MELKVKLMNLSAGVPVAILNIKTAEKLGVHARDRISIKKIKSFQKTSAIVDIINGSVKENEIAVSSELKIILGLKKSQKVQVDLAPTPKSLVFIKKKLDKKTLSQEEINEIIKDVVNNSLAETEIALFISAMYKQGMNFNETIYLIKAILNSGNVLKLKNKFIVDKHSIGGIPGNRTTPIIVSICAAAGLTMPKNSSRAITSAAGTADVIETIAKVDFTMKEVKNIISKTNACMVWGGALGMVPADSKIIRIEKSLKIDPEAQLLASIMSKKLSVGSKYILIDIPYGKTAKVTKNKAKNLKTKFERIGKYFNKKLKVILTKGDQPIGNGIGPFLELVDVIKILDPNKKGPQDLREKSIFLAAELLELTGKIKRGKGIEKATEILDSGKAFEKFKQIIKAQQGDIEKIKTLKPAKFKKEILAKESQRIKEIDNKKINGLAKIAGCPEDKYSGLYLHAHVGNTIKKSQKILTIYSESKYRLNQAINFYKKQKPINFH